MSGFSPDWLRAQRWFRAKQRPIATVGEADRAALGDAGDLLVIEVGYADAGAPDRYLVPTIDGREPRDGDGVWAAFVRLMASGAEVRADRGRFAFDATPALDDLLPSARDAAGALGERRLGVEQSNSSVVLGERLILKVYRLLEEGENPDLEVSAFLSDAGFAHTPALAGSVHYRPDGGERCAAAMLQAFVPSTGDAWALVLDRLATDPAAAIEAAEEIGRLTAELHAALASHPQTPGFPARAVTPDELAAWRQGAERQLDGALA
ncbi:MAG: maltokinase N-terminal cap-like domain-containing protein, partial [Candidatus Limnocylindria bacterium]